MPLADEFFTLNAEQKRIVHFILCQYALTKWALYSNSEGTIQYTETVIGTRQQVDMQLPYDAFTAAQVGTDSRNVAQRYQEPIAALQDEDLSLPQPVTFGYYAIYNLFQKYVADKVVEDWLIVNQALSAEENEDLWNSLLGNAIHMAKQQ